MQERNPYSRQDEARTSEPKVIAIAATQTAVSSGLLAGAGMAALAYLWLTLLPH